MTHTFKDVPVPSVGEVVENLKSQFPSTSSDVEWSGDGHFCQHHPDDSAHGDSCYSFLEYIGLFTRLHTALATRDAANRAEERNRIMLWAMQTLPYYPEAQKAIIGFLEEGEQA